LAKKFEAKGLALKRAGRLPADMMPTSTRLGTGHCPTGLSFAPTTSIVDEAARNLKSRWWSSCKTGERLAGDEKNNAPRPLAGELAAQSQTQNPKTCCIKNNAETIFKSV